jgi:outer membrane protein OmpA-like peptidoglycan-associated protein
VLVDSDTSPVVRVIAPQYNADTLTRTFARAGDARTATMTARMPRQLKAAMPPKPSFTPARRGLLQRKCACRVTPDATGECEECRRKRLQGKVTQPSTLNHQHSEVPPIVHEVLRAPGQPLDQETRIFMELRFGHDFSQVRVHTDTKAADSARAVNALAYTVGQNVVFGQGQYSPRTSNGQRLMAHELSHTVQQSCGGVPTLSGSVCVSEAGHADEREAEAVAEKVVAGGNNETGVADIHPATSAIQRIGDPTKVPPGLELECEIASDSPASTSEDLLFGNNVSTLSALQQAQIDNFVVNWRADGGNADVRVDGYTSTPGTDELNWRLSCNRAEEVVNELMTPSSGVPGIPAGFIRTVAQGETTEFGAEASNRRATISSPIPTPPTPTPPPPPPAVCPAVPSATPGTCPERHTGYCNARSCFPSDPWLDCVCTTSGQICDAIDAFHFSGTEGSLLELCVEAEHKGHPMGIPFIKTAITDKGDWFRDVNSCIWGHWRTALDALHDPTRPISGSATPEWSAAIATCRASGVGSPACCKAQVEAEQKAIDTCSPYDSSRLGTLPTDVPSTPGCSSIAARIAPGPTFAGDFGKVADRIAYGNRRCCP